MSVHSPAVPTVFVDFNDDENDVICALLKRVSAPYGLDVGQAVRLADYEGNLCLGYVVGIDNRSVRLKPEYSTWIDAEPIRFTQPPLEPPRRPPSFSTSSADTEAMPRVPRVAVLA